MKDSEVFDVLQTKAAELSEWLKNNFDPYVAIIITDTEVKIVRTEYGVPIGTISSRDDKDDAYQGQREPSQVTKNS